MVETMYEETVLEVAAPNGSVGDTGPSDASAVPELSPSLLSDAWEPAIVVDYPVEPSEDHSDGDVEVPEGSDDPGRPEPAVAGDDRRDEAASLVHTVLFGDPPTATGAPDEPVPDERARPPRGTAAPTEPEEQLLPLDVPDQPTPAIPPKAPRRKRASVPSWDEIVFGGPKESTPRWNLRRRAGGAGAVGIGDPVAPRARVDRARSAGRLERQQGVCGGDARAAVEHRLTLEVGVALGDLRGCPEPTGLGQVRHRGRFTAPGM